MDKYISPHAKPTAHEDELLTVLIEEAAEVIVAATKLKRFGGEDGYPGTGRTNSDDLGAEVGDLLEMVDRLVMVGVIKQEAISRGMARKAEKLAVYLQTETDN